MSHGQKKAGGGRSARTPNFENDALAASIPQFEASRGIDCLSTVAGGPRCSLRMNMDSVVDGVPMTLEIRRMNQILFGPRARGATAVTDTAVRQMLEKFREARELAGFRIWLVGSRLEANRETSDVDVVLSPRGPERPRDRTIEDALWFCRLYGLETMVPICVVDPCFREAGPTLEIVDLPADSIVTTTKLLSPNRQRDVLEGRIRDYRLAGHFSIEYSRRVGDTTYYSKLPLRFSDEAVRYLRPAVEMR